jgi:ABC-type dipeptide/oligopeptide/nickel transport system ATPase component
MQLERGTAVILITHDIGVVSSFCDCVLVMYAGPNPGRGTYRATLLSAEASMKPGAATLDSRLERC